MWETTRDREIDPDRWEDAGPYWQRIMRDFARATLMMLDHG
ncbi:hypothetical protein NOVOSPHI9U_20072 [Novosphingobium sp. 9U]|nr:hypothetical protein NOVOSPHI9U_20072 [Novosphingobium sp. 9U]